MNPAWFAVTTQDASDSGKLQRRRHMNEELKLRLLDSRRTQIGLDLDTLTSQMKDSQLKKKIELESLRAEADAMSVEILGFAKDSAMARMHKLDAQKEYAQYLSAQVQERIKDTPEAPVHMVVSLPTDDPNELAERHRREIARVQCQMLLTQMAEATSAGDKLIGSPDPAPDPHALMHRELLLEHRKQQRLELDLANMEMARLRHQKSAVRPPSPRLLRQPSPHHQTDFKGVSKDEYRLCLLSNEELIQQKQAEYTKLMDEERKSHEIATLRALSETEREKRESERRRDEKHECDRQRKPACLLPNVPDDYNEFFNKRFGNSLF